MTRTSEENPEQDLIGGSTTLPAVTVELFRYWLELEYIRSLPPITDPVPLRDAKRIDPDFKLLHMRIDFHGPFFMSFDLWRGRGRRGYGEFLLSVSAYMRRTDQLTVEYMGEDADFQWGVKTFGWWLNKTFGGKISEMEREQVEQMVGQRFRLSAREQEVLDLVLQGLGNTEIAQELMIEAETIRSHKENIGVKLGIGSTSDTKKLKAAIRAAKGSEMPPDIPR